MAKVAKKEVSKATKVNRVDTKDIAKVDVSAYPTKSAKIRFYLSKGFERKVIAQHLDIKYQHVRNVEVTLLKKDIKK